MLKINFKAGSAKIMWILSASVSYNIANQQNLKETIQYIQYSTVPTSE
jgi:hypothetical protein